MVLITAARQPQGTNRAAPEPHRLAALRPQVRQWNPDNTLHFMIEVCLIRPLPFIDIGGHHHRAPLAVTAGQQVRQPSTEEAMPPEIQAGFLKSFPAGGGTGRNITGLHTASGKRHVSGPRVPLPVCSLDKQQFRLSAITVAVDQGNRRPRHTAPERQFLWSQCSDPWWFHIHSPHAGKNPL